MQHPILWAAPVAPPVHSTTHTANTVAAAGIYAGLVVIISGLLVLWTRADKNLTWRHTLTIFVAGVMCASVTGIGPVVTGWLTSLGTALAGSAG